MEFYIDGSGDPSLFPPIVQSPIIIICLKIHAILAEGEDDFGSGSNYYK